MSRVMNPTTRLKAKGKGMNQCGIRMILQLVLAILQQLLRRSKVRPRMETGKLFGPHSTSFTLSSLAKSDTRALRYNAYYFHNSKTNVTTWENPITSTKPIPTAPVNPLKRPADALEGIDPDLAYLDPSLSNPLGPQGKFNATARFNARTGKFEADPEKNPDRVSDFNRAKRQNAFFFDVDGWEKQKAEENMAKMKAEAEGRVEKKKKPTKAELERYKARAAEKKHAR